MPGQTLNYSRPSACGGGSSRVPTLSPEEVKEDGEGDEKWGGSARDPDGRTVGGTQMNREQGSWRETEVERGWTERRREAARKGGGREGGEKGEEPGAREGSWRLSRAGVGRGQACRRELVCRAAAGSCSRLGAPGPGEGERPLTRSMSFSDSSATFLLNEVTTGGPPFPVGGRRALLQAKERARIWGRLQHEEGGKSEVRPRIKGPLGKRGRGSQSSEVLGLEWEGGLTGEPEKGLD